MLHRAVVTWMMLCAGVAGPCAGAAGSDASLGEATPAGATSAAANDPVSVAPGRLPEPEPPPDASPIDATPSPAPLSDHERRPLGKPVSLFSAHPRTAAESADQSSGGGLGALELGRNSVVRVLGATALVAVLAWIAARMMRRMGGVLACNARPSGVIDVLARYPVARGQQLVLIKLGRRIVLAHQSAAAMSTLCELTDEHEVAAMLARVEAGSREPLAGRFQSLLERFNAEHNATERRGGDERAEVAVAAAGGGEEIELVDLTRRAGRRSRPGASLRALLGNHGGAQR